MKFGILSAAAILVAGFSVLEAPAQETIKSTGTVVTTSDYRTVQQPARTGLFSRLRNRNNNTNIAPASMTTEPAMIVPGSTTPAATTTPATTTTTPVTVEPTTQTAQPRQGIFARLRARR